MDNAGLNTKRKNKRKQKTRTPLGKEIAPLSANRAKEIEAGTISNTLSSKLWRLDFARMLANLISFAVNAIKPNLVSTMVKTLNPMKNQEARVRGATPTLNQEKRTLRAGLHHGLPKPAVKSNGETMEE